MKALTRKGGRLTLPARWSQWPAAANMNHPCCVLCTHGCIHVWWRWARARGFNAPCMHMVSNRPSHVQHTQTTPICTPQLDALLSLCNFTTHTSLLSVT
eukprot:UN2572